MIEKEKEINKNESTNENNIYINNIQNRILSLSPTVKAGIERECTKDDFYSEDNKEIGRGGYSHVWKVSHKNTGKIYCIKLMSKQKIIQEKICDQINREVEIMYKTNHPHIIKLINHFEDDQNVYLIMELGAKGQLFSLLKKFSHGIDQMRAAQYMREIISAVKYLHSMNPPIIHRDIKPENILLDNDGRCKLADFGWSNYFIPSKLRRTFCGTPQYLAPEMVEKKGHGPEVDIWALGVLCFELLTGKLPFNGNNNQEIYKNIKTLNIDWQGDDFNPLAKNLITKILRYDPKERPSLDEILTQPWFESYPLSYPLLEVKNNITYEEYLEEHTVSIQKKEDKKENKIITQKKTTITDVVKQINSDNKNNSQKMNNNSKENEQINNNIQKDNEEKEKINNKNEESNKAMKEKIDSIVNPLNKIIDSQKSLISEMKQKNDKYQLELDKLKKELSSKNEQQKTIDTLNDQIEKYKLKDTERLHLLAELENKNTTIVSLNSKLKEKEEDIKRFEKMDENSKEELKKNKAIMTSLENKILELNNKLNENEIIKQKALDEMENKNRTLRQKLVEDALTSNKFNKIILSDIIEISLNELKDLLKNKTEKITKILTQIETTVTNSIKQPTEFIENMNQELKNLTQSTEKSLEEVNKNSIVIIENEIKSKLKLQFDWQNKQIDELMEYKIKAKNLETKMGLLEDKNKNLEETAQIIKDNNDNLYSLIKEKNEKIKELENKLIDTENFNAYLKDFILQERSIDEYEEFLENHGK